MDILYFQTNENDIKYMYNEYINMQLFIYLSCQGIKIVKNIIYIVCN